MSSKKTIKTISAKNRPHHTPKGAKTSPRGYATGMQGHRQTGQLAKTARSEVALVNQDQNAQQVSGTVVTWAKRSRFNPLRRLTPEYLAQILDSWNNGYLRDFAYMADAMKHRDMVMRTALSKREKGVARHGFEVLLLDGLDEARQARAKEHQEALKWFYDHLEATDIMEQDVSGGFSLLVRQMMYAQGDRYSVHEIVWQPSIDPLSNKPRLTATFNRVPNWFFEATTGKLRFIPTWVGAMYGEDMIPEQWLVTVGEGLLETLSTGFVIKHTALEAWAGYSERFGTPGVHGKTSAVQGSPAWNAFATAVAAFGQEWATISSQDATIELIEAKGGSGTIPMPPLIEGINKEIAALVRGADLSTISSGASGAGGQGRGASLQGDETELLEQDDAELISDTLVKVSRIVINQLFGEEPLAYLQIIVAEKKLSTDTISKIQFLVNSGVPVGAEYARKELGIPPPVDGEQVLERQGPAPSASAPGEDPEEKEPNEQENEKALANVHPQVDAAHAVFRRNAVRKLTEAQMQAVQPVLDRIASLKSLSDEDYAAGLLSLRADLPKLFAEARLQAPDIASVWEQILGTALIDGLTETP